MVTHSQYQEEAVTACLEAIAVVDDSTQFALTGTMCVGKSTVGNEVAIRSLASGRHVVALRMACDTRGTSDAIVSRTGSRFRALRTSNLVVTVEKLIAEASDPTNLLLLIDEGHFDAIGIATAALSCRSACVDLLVMGLHNGINGDVMPIYEEFSHERTMVGYCTYCTGASTQAYLEARNFCRPEVRINFADLVGDVDIWSPLCDDCFAMRQSAFGRVRIGSFATDDEMLLALHLMKEYAKIGLPKTAVLPRVDAIMGQLHFHDGAIVGADNPEVLVNFLGADPFAPETNPASRILNDALNLRSA